MDNSSDTKRGASKASSVPGWRRTARAVRWLPDRLLHPLRRRAAIARLRDGPMPTNVLCVCHGNICRSPYAAAALIHALPTESRAKTAVRSSGFIGPGRPPPAEAARAALDRGIDLSAHLSQLTTADHAREASLIVVMDPRQRRAIHTRFGRSYRDVLVLGDLDPWPISRRTIQDPFDQPLETFVAVYDRIDRCIDELVSATAPRATAQPVVKPV